MNMSILVYPDPNELYILFMDASKYACLFTSEEVLQKTTFNAKADNRGIKPSDFNIRLTLIKGIKTYLLMLFLD